MAGVARPRVRRRRPLWTLLLPLLVVLLLAAAASPDDRSSNQHAHEQEKETLTQGALVPIPRGGNDRRSATTPRLWRSFHAAAEIGLLLTAVLECIGLGTYYIWGSLTGLHQQQPGAALAGVAGGGGGGGGGPLLPEWVGTLWAQHWPDIQQHLPPPWGLLAGQLQAYGPSVGAVVATAGALVVVGVCASMASGILSLPCCWEDAARSEEGGAQEEGQDSSSGLPWWVLWVLRQCAWATWQARSTGPCSIRSLDVRVCFLSLGSTIVSATVALGEHIRAGAVDAAAWVLGRRVHWMLGWVVLPLLLAAVAVWYYRDWWEFELQVRAML